MVNHWNLTMKQKTIGLYRYLVTFLFVWIIFHFKEYMINSHRLLTLYKRIDNNFLVCYGYRENHPHIRKCLKYWQVRLKINV